MNFIPCLQLLTGSGPVGEIRANDVKSYKPIAQPAHDATATQPQPSFIPAAQQGLEFMDIPLTGMRKV